MFLHVFIGFGKTNLSTASLDSEVTSPRENHNPCCRSLTSLSLETFLLIYSPEIEHRYQEWWFETFIEYGVILGPSIHSFSFWSPGVVVGTPGVGARGPIGWKKPGSTPHSWEKIAVLQWYNFLYMSRFCTGSSFPIWWCLARKVAFGNSLKKTKNTTIHHAKAVLQVIQFATFLSLPVGGHQHPTNPPTGSRRETHPKKVTWTRRIEKSLR